MNQGLHEGNCPRYERVDLDGVQGGVVAHAVHCLAIQRRCKPIETVIIHGTKLLTGNVSS
jgi:hypothetical protein